MITNEIVKEEPTLAFEPVIELPKVAPIEHNLSIIEEYAKDLKEFWQPVVFTADQVDKAKDVRASVNKLVKKVADLRKEKVAEYKQPIDDFESTAKTTEKLLKETADLLGQKIDVFVKLEQDKKQAEINNLIEVILSDELYKEIKFEEIVQNPKWLNKTYTMTTIEADILDMVKDLLQDKANKKLIKENLKLKLEQLDPGHLLNHDVYLTKLEFMNDLDIVYASAQNDLEELNRVASNTIAKAQAIDIDSIFSSETKYRVTFEGTLTELDKLKEYAKQLGIKEV